MNVTQAVDTFDNILGVLQKVAATPGVNLIPYVNVAGSAIGVLRAAIAAGKNIEPFVTRIRATFGPDKKIPTPEDLKALDADLKKLEAQVDEPLPPKEEGETD